MARQLLQNPTRRSEKAKRDADHEVINSNFKLLSYFARRSDGHLFNRLDVTKLIKKKKIKMISMCVCLWYYYISLYI